MTERVIFREDYLEKGGFIAIFPDDPANLTGYAAVAFHDSYQGITFEPFMEINRLYMMKCKIVHKHDERIPALVKILENRYPESKFTVCEKITAEMDKNRTAWIYE